MKMKPPIALIGAVLCSLTTSTLAAAGPTDGIWEAVLAGHTQVIALVERTDGRLLGYTPSSPASWIVGGQRIGSSVTINLDGRDPIHVSDPGTIVGIRSGSQITGTFTDSSGTTAITLQSVDAPRTVAHWLMGPSTSGDVLDRASRVEDGAGEFVTGGFVGMADCSFLDCRGRITSWTVAGTAHAILTDSGGACPSTSTLSGTWDIGMLLLNGTYTTTPTCLPTPVSGGFFGGKEGLTNASDILGVLGLLRDFADRVEAESPAAVDAFATTYLHDGKSRADWQAQLAAMYAVYDGLRVTIDAVRQVVTFGDAEVNPQAISSPRLEWHISVTGVPTGGGPRAAVLDVTSTFDGDQQLYWIGREAGRSVFKGNGYAAPFSLALPIQTGDSTRIAYGIWPYGVHGGGHPEGHPGWDFEYRDGSMALAAADGVVREITVDTTEFPGQFNIGVQDRPGYRTHYDHIGTLGAGIAVGAGVAAGQALGTAGDVGPFNATHFGLDRSTGSVCPLSYLNASSRASFDSLWQTAAYEEELVEPFPCNPIAVTFPLTRVWTRISGSLPAVVEFTRPDAHTTEYRYTLRNGSGGILQRGAVVALQPSATLDSGTFDLQPDGSPTSTRLARYRIVSNEMRVAWAATRPVDLAGASIYSTTDPGFPPLTALSPAKVRVGLKNSDDVGTKFDFLAEVLRNGDPVGSGEIDGVSGGSSGFTGAVLSTIDLVLTANVAFSPGDTLSFRLKARVAATSGHRSGTARLWFDDAAADAHFDATIGGATQNYYLRNGFVLQTAPGAGPKKTIDVFVDRAVGGNPWKSFGTWSISF